VPVDASHALRVGTVIIERVDVTKTSLLEANKEEEVIT
jgi:hypothetical protein